MKDDDATRLRWLKQLHNGHLNAAAKLAKEIDKIERKGGVNTLEGVYYPPGACNTPEGETK